jgi:hypothetical protein
MDRVPTRRRATYPVRAPYSRQERRNGDRNAGRARQWELGRGRVPTYTTHFPARLRVDSIRSSLSGVSPGMGEVDQRDPGLAEHKIRRLRRLETDLFTPEDWPKHGPSFPSGSMG